MRRGRSAALPGDPAGGPTAAARGAFGHIYVEEYRPCAAAHLGTRDGTLAF